MLNEYAIGENGCRVDIADAKYGNKHYCPECNGELIVKNGPILRKHFSHKVLTTHCVFYGNSQPESESHKKAKKVLFGMSELSFTFLKKCPSCNSFMSQTYTQSCDSTVLEYRYKGFLIDVVYFVRGVPVFGIEVVHSHRSRHSRLMNIDFFVIEVRAENIIATPNQLLILQANRELGFKCESCERRLLDAIDRAKPGKGYSPKLRAEYYLRQSRLNKWLPTRSNRSRVISEPRFDNSHYEAIEKRFKETQKRDADNLLNHLRGYKS